MSESVLLAVGHGEQPSGVHDPGAVSGEWSEQRAMDYVIGTAAAALREDGRLTVYDEAFQDDDNFIGTTRKANDLEVSIVVSAHQDWSGGLDEIHGFWYPGSEDGERLVKTITKAYGNAGLPVSDKWVKARSDLYLLRETTMPAALIEHGRVGDEDWSGTAFLESIGVILAASIIDYFGFKGTVPNPVTDTLPDTPKKPAPEQTPDTPSAPKFPLPRGHWYGKPSRNPRNHSGYFWKSDRRGIRIAQNRLQDRGWTISVDGKFGPNTEQVIRAFQREKGLIVDGLLGPATWKTLWTAPIT